MGMLNPVEGSSYNTHFQSNHIGVGTGVCKSVTLVTTYTAFKP